MSVYSCWSQLLMIRTGVDGYLQHKCGEQRPGKLSNRQCPASWKILGRSSAYTQSRKRFAWSQTYQIWRRRNECCRHKQIVLLTLHKEMISTTICDPLVLVENMSTRWLWILLRPTGYKTLWTKFPRLCRPRAPIESRICKTTPRRWRRTVEILPQASEAASSDTMEGPVFVEDIC